MTVPQFNGFGFDCRLYETSTNLRTDVHSFFNGLLQMQRCFHLDRL